jgi:RNA polymerase sigma factor (sigma-70 family)
VPLDELEPVLAESPHRGPDRLQSSSEIREWLRGALARLNPRIARMFVLRFFEGKENPEIARLLNTTPGTVAVTLSRTRDRLQQDYRSYVGGVA